MGVAGGDDGVTAEGDWPPDVICDGIKSGVVGVGVRSEEVVVGCGTTVDGDDSGPGAAGGSGPGVNNGKPVKAVPNADVLERPSRTDAGAGSLMGSVGTVEVIVIDVTVELSRFAADGVEVEVFAVPLLEAITVRDWDLGLAPVLCHSG